MVVAKVAIFTMMGLITASTAGRYLFGSPIQGMVEIVERFLMVALVYMSVAKVERVGGHVNVDILSRRMPELLRRLLYVAFITLTVVILMVIIYGTAITSYDHLIRWSRTTGVIRLPVFFSWVLIPIGFTLLTIRLLWEVYEELAWINRRYIGASLSDYRSS